MGGREEGEEAGHIPFLLCGYIMDSSLFQLMRLPMTATLFLCVFVYRPGWKVGGQWGNCVGRPIYLSVLVDETPHS